MEYQNVDVYKYLETLNGQITFRYCGKNCGIDPISHTEYNMWYGEDCYTAGSVREAVCLRFFCGKSLKEILNQIRILEFEWSGEGWKGRCEL